MCVADDEEGRVDTLEELTEVVTPPVGEHVLQHVAVLAGVAAYDVCEDEEVATASTEHIGEAVQPQHTTLAAALTQPSQLALHRIYDVQVLATHRR